MKAKSRRDMPLGHEYLFGSDSPHSPAASCVRVRARMFQVPPIRDVAVIGRTALMTREIMAKTLQLISPEPFVVIDVRDDTVDAILVREAVLRKLGAEAVKKIVLRKIKPLMGKSEVLALQLEIEIALGEEV